jgi:hypothetical protein
VDEVTVTLSEVQELCELIAPRMFGKKYHELDFMMSFAKAQDSEAYRCAAEATKIRFEALERLRKATGRGYADTKWPELLQFCEQVIAERGLLREPGEEG